MRGGKRERWKRIREREKKEKEGKKKRPGSE